MILCAFSRHMSGLRAQVLTCASMSCINFWPIASFRGEAAIRSLSGRSGHPGTSVIDRLRRE